MKQNERKGGCEHRRVTESRYVILRIPRPSFHLLLRLWALFDPDPPFTTDQLTVLTAGDEFQIICWERIVGIVAPRSARQNLSPPPCIARWPSSSETVAASIPERAGGRGRHRYELSHCGRLRCA